MTTQQGSPLSGFDETFRVVDMHTHMFNARYLPLGGIFKTFNIPERFLTPLTRICWFLTDFSKFPDLPRKEPTHLNAKRIKSFQSHELHESLCVNAFIESLSADCETLISACLPTGSISIAEATVASLEPSDLDVETATTQTLALSTIASVIDVFEFRSSLDDATFVFEDQADLGAMNTYRFVDLFKAFFRQVFSALESALDYADFFWNLTQTERQIFLRIRAFYASADVECTLVHHMMDMSHPYRIASGNPSLGQVKIPYYPRSKWRPEPSQLSQMRALGEFSSGQLIGFSAFDPKRFVDAKDISWAVTKALDKARNDFNMAGFKFYPPMGYRADEDKNSDVGKAITAFLRYCIRFDTPVFAHCTPGGFEVSFEAGLNSDPVYWRNMLEAECWVQDLRLCLGHAGGGRYCRDKDSSLISAGWVGCEAEWALPTNYAKNVVALCRDFKNIYCELSNIDTILEHSADKNNLMLNLRRELKDVSGSSQFRDKIMYGTDWHMVGMVNDVVDYFQTLSEIFDQPDFATFKSGFFYDNAVNYLKKTG